MSTTPRLHPRLGRWLGAALCLLPTALAGAADTPEVLTVSDFRRNLAAAS